MNFQEKRAMVGVLLLAAVFFGACQEGATPPSTGTSHQALQPQPPPTKQPPPGFFVSPRWSPDGQHLLLSGRQGVGLYLLNPQTKQVRTLHSTFVGRALWHSTQEIRLFAFPRGGKGGNSEVIFNMSLQLETGRFAELKNPPTLWIDPKTKYLHHVLYQKKGVRITYEWYRQRLSIQSQGRSQTLENLWGVAISSDGRKIAYSRGLLANATLYVWQDGNETNMGPGTYPSWSPAGRYLVYGRPLFRYNAKKMPQLTGANLHLVQFPTGRSVPLTESPHRTDMEPAFSPTGDRIAFSDWRSGKIQIIPFSGMGR